MDFFARIIEVKDGTRVKLQVCYLYNLIPDGIEFNACFSFHIILALGHRYVIFTISIVMESEFHACFSFNTAGQERFRSITKSYYRNSVGVLLVYDICNHASFEHIPLWMMEAKRHIEPHRPVFALTGCKLDLVSNGAQREVSRDEAKAFADQNGLFFVETSARTGVNVEEVFKTVTEEVYARIQSGEYKVEEGWDGIKTGFARPNGLDFNLIVAQPEKSTCC